MSCCCGTPERVGPQGNRDGKEGVEEERGCTDVVFLFIFAAFLGGLGYGLYYAVERGDDARIIFGFDYAGDICGRTNLPLPNISNSGKDTTKLTFLDLTQIKIQADNFEIRTNGTCVDKCPTEKLALLQRCLPLKEAVDASEWVFTTSGLNNFLSQFALDFELCWLEVVYLCLIAVGLSLVMTILFRLLAGLVIWCILIALVLGSLAGTGYLWWVWYTAEATTAGSGMLAYAILSSVGALLIILIVLVMRSRVQLVATLFREAGKCIHAMPFLLIQPIWTLIALILLCAGWIYAAIWIESAGVATIENGSPVFFKKDAWLQVVRWYNILAALWISQLCLACQSFIIAGSVANWFFTRDKSRLGCPIARSTGYCVRYHLGSLAFGSLLIALMKLVRMLFSYLERKLKGAGTDCCGMIKCLTCFCKCCLYCFEKFLQAICSNAYIEIAIYGENFCWSAGRAFKMLASNALRVIAINSVGDFILFLGKVGIVTAVVFIGIELIKDKPGVVYVWAPILIAAIFAYLIAHCFISVYEMCIDSIFICFCEDCEINDGQEKPYYMSRGLMEFVENSKSALRSRARRDRGGHDNQGFAAENNAKNNRY